MAALLQAHGVPVAGYPNIGGTPPSGAPFNNFWQLAKRSTGDVNQLIIRQLGGRSALRNDEVGMPAMQRFITTEAIMPIRMIP